MSDLFWERVEQALKLRPRRGLCYLLERSRLNGEKSPERLETDSALDKLSNLPSRVLDQILCRLPIKDAVRTSVLSSKWHCKWFTMPELVFDDEPVNVIDEVLLQHIDAISKFELDRTKPTRSSDLHRWISHLSHCLVEEFKLKLWQPTPYKLHSRLFSFQDLVHLELYYCQLKLPSTFGGFKKLKKLKLENLYMAQDAFDTLISSCPILEMLTLFLLYGFNHLNIAAPNLLKIQFEGCFDDLNLVNCTKLEDVSIKLAITDDAFEGIKARGSSNLLKFFSSLPRIKRLEIGFDFLKYLAAGDIPRQLPNPCTNLVYLRLEIYNYNYAECSAALCLLRSSPNLQELHIVFQESQEGNEFNFWESKHTDCSFNKLRTVYINADAMNKNNLELIGFILLASPVLQKMTINSTLFTFRKSSIAVGKRAAKVSTSID